MAKYHGRKQPNLPYRLGSFKLEGLEHLKVGYRLASVSGLVEGDDEYEKKVRQLAVLIGGKIKMPVEPVRIENETRLAIVAPPEKLAALVIENKYSLTPDDAIVSLGVEIFDLQLRESANRMHTKLARRALDWAIDEALKSPKTGWWKYDQRFIAREPFAADGGNEINVHPAFYFSFVPGRDGFFELSVNPSVCYVERRSVFEKYGDKISLKVKGRRFLYRNGLDYYNIAAVGIGKAAGTEMMEDPNSGELITIQQRLLNRWGGKGLPLIDRLDGSAPTVAYKTKGEKSRKAHSQLLFELVGVDGSDEGHRSPHNEAIMNPEKRGPASERIIAQIGTYLRLYGVTLKPNPRMRVLNGEVTLFRAPKLRFKDDEELTTNLETIRRDRFDALKHIGASDHSDFADEQLFICGDALPDEVRIDFKKRFLDQVFELYGRRPTFTNVKVEDRRARVLREQFNAIDKAVAGRRGYGLMVLPKERAAGNGRKLHDALKRRFWNQVHTQCAAAETILGFYRSRVDRFGETVWFVPDGKRGRYNSYLQFLALGYLEVNQKNLWKLAPGTLKNDVHIGIDVYQDLAVVTFVYGGADLVTFLPIQTKRGEKLSASLVREAIITQMNIDLKQLGMTPRSIVVHRDGRVFRSEAIGIVAALDELRDLGRIAPDFKYAIVEIHKTSSTRLRLYKWANGKFRNPDMGTFVELSEYEGILTTTGAPLLSRGTAQPLSIEIFKGNIPIGDIAHDIYALSHLAFASPGCSMSLPYTISLADKILRESSPGNKIDLWDDADEDQADDLFMRHTAAGSRTAGMRV